MTTSATSRQRRTLHITAATVVLAFAATMGVAHAESAFGGLSGSWSGSGVAHFEGGRNERVSCRANYNSGSTRLNLSLRCATQSANVNLQGALTAHGNRVSGDWSESSFGASGDAVGSASGGTMRLRLSGSASGTLVVSTSGSSQSVSITTSGVGLRGVSINMRRR